MYYKNGDRYEGEWKNDDREGKGILYYKNGDRYDGEWKNDKREGKGILYYNKDDYRDREEGIWEYDKIKKGKTYNKENALSANPPLGNQKK